MKDKNMNTYVFTWLPINADEIDVDEESTYEVKATGIVDAIDAFNNNCDCDKLYAVTENGKDIDFDFFSVF